MSGPLGFISVSALRQYLASAEAHGVAVAPALAAAGIHARELSSAGARINGERFEPLLLELIRRSGDPLFGLRTSEHIDTDVYDVMGHIAMNTATILEALDKVMRYEKLVGDMGTTTIVVMDDLSQVRWHCRYPRQPVRRHLIENVLASWLRYARGLAGNNELAPREVWLEHGPPVHANPQLEYQRLFGCPVRFHQPYSALVGTSALLSLPLPGQPRNPPDPAQLSRLEEQATRRLQQLGVPLGLVGQVRLRLEAALGGPLPDRAQMAAILNMTPRTLYRRLRAEGSGWQQLLNQVRLDAAKQQLRGGRLPQSQIARELGYADIRCFQRVFKQHLGITPGAFRRGDSGPRCQ